LTVDTEEDFKLMEQIYKKLYNGNPIPLSEALNLLYNEPELLLINKEIRQKPV